MAKRYKYKTKSYTSRGVYEFDEDIEQCPDIAEGWRIVSVIETGFNKMIALLEKPETDG